MYNPKSIFVTLLYVYIVESVKTYKEKNKECLHPLWKHFHWCNHALLSFVAVRSSISKRTRLRLPLIIWRVTGGCTGTLWKMAAVCEWAKVALVQRTMLQEELWNRKKFDCRVLWIVYEKARAKELYRLRSHPDDLNCHCVKPLLQS